MPAGGAIYTHQENSALLFTLFVLYSVGKQDKQFIEKQLSRSASKSQYRKRIKQKHAKASEASKANTLSQKCGSLCTCLYRIV